MTFHVYCVCVFSGQAHDVAQKYRQIGKLDQALEYADPDTHPRFRVECILAKARISLRARKPIPTEELQESLDLFQKIRSASSEDLCLKAECTLLLGKDQSDISLLNEALSCYLKGQHVCGQVESASCLRQCNGFTMDIHAKGKIIGTLRKNIALVVSLSKTSTARSQLEKGNIETCHRFFGLATDQGKMRMLVHEGPRMLMLPNLKQQLNIRTERDAFEEKDANMAIRDYLMTELLKATSDVKSSLLQDLQRHQLCRDFVLGRSCPGQAAGSQDTVVCNARHQSHDHDSYKMLISILGQIISVNNLDTEALHGVKDMAIIEYVEAKMKYQKGMDELKYTNLLMDELFPKYYHPRVMTYIVKITYDLIRLISSEAVIFSMKQRLKKLQREMQSAGDGLANTEKLLKVFWLEMITTGKTDSLYRFMIEEEAVYEKAVNRKQNPNRLGIFSIRLQSGRLYWCSFRKFISAFEALYKKENPMDAFGDLMMFFSFLAKFPYTPLLPTLASCLQIMEIQIVLVAGIYLRHSLRPTPVLLPASYLAALNFWDTIFRAKLSADGRSLYSVIQYFVPQVRWQGQFNGRLRTFTNIFCGATHRYRNFNILGRSFTQEALESGECERTLILSLVLLCNSGISSVLPLDCGNVIWQTLSWIDTSHLQNVPPRIAEALDGIRTATTQVHLVMTLKTLLMKREDEFLYRCNWDWQTIGRGSNHGIMYHKFEKLNFVETRIFEPMVKSVSNQRIQGGPAMHTPAKWQTDKVCNIPDDDLEGSLPEEEMQMTETQIWELQEQKMRAEEEKKMQQMEAEKSAAETASVSPLYDRIQVDDDMCGICKIPFRKVSALVRGMDDEMEESVVDEEREQKGETKKQDADTTVAADYPTKEGHLKSQSHGQKAIEFENFVRCHDKKIVPLQNDIQTFRTNLERDSPGKVLEDLGNNLYEMGVLQKKMEKMMGDIERDCQWGATVDLNRAYDDLKDLFATVKTSYKLMKEEGEQVSSV